MRHLTVVVGLSLGMLFARSVKAHSATEAGSLAGTYGCEFYSPDYDEPTTNSTVPISGIFTLTIGKDGTVNQEDTTISVRGLRRIVDPAVCNYDAGTGAVILEPGGGILAAAEITSPAANGNSPQCPSGLATLYFNAINQGLSLLYSSSSGFIGTGSCELGNTVHSTRSFNCTYQINDSAGGGAGSATVRFAPPFDPKKQTIENYGVSITGLDQYPDKNVSFACPQGKATYNIHVGSWNKGGSATDSACPATPFNDNVTFIASGSDLVVAASGLSNAKCSPGRATSNTQKIDVMPRVIDFDGQTVNKTSAPKPIIIKNSGEEAVEMNGFAILSPFDQTNNCPFPDSLPAGAACTVMVTFTPTVKLAFSRNLQIFTSAGSGEVDVKLNGTGQ